MTTNNTPRDTVTVRNATCRYRNDRGDNAKLWVCDIAGGEGGRARRAILRAEGDGVVRRLVAGPERGAAALVVRVGVRVRAVVLCEGGQWARRPYGEGGTH